MNLVADLAVSVVGSLIATFLFHLIYASRNDAQHPSALRATNGSYEVRKNTIKSPPQVERSEDQIIIRGSTIDVRWHPPYLQYVLFFGLVFGILLLPLTLT